MRKIFVHFTKFNFHTFSPGTRNLLLNPEDRKSSTMEFVVSNCGIRFEQKYITPKRITSPYMSRAMLWFFFTGLIRGTAFFLAKYGIKELNVYPSKK